MEKIIEAWKRNKKISCFYIDYNDMTTRILVNRIHLNNHGIFELYHDCKYFINPIPIMKFYRVSNVIILNDDADMTIKPVLS